MSLIGVGQVMFGRSMQPGLTSSGGLRPAGVVMPGGVTLCLTASMVVAEHAAVYDLGAMLNST